ncbi:DUF885 family protein [Pseudomonas sp. BC115LW]|nr:DUF885 family protein [Pseudomonas sp. BC115LW]
MPVKQNYLRGKQEVARIRSERDEVRFEICFQGDLPALFQYLLSHLQYVWSAPARLMRAFQQIAQRVDSHIPLLFSHTPRAPLEIKPVPAACEATDGRAKYSQGSADG